MAKRFLLLGLGLFLACSSPEPSPTSAFFGGQIINPSSDYISLYKYDQRIDYLALDENNRFAKRYDSLDFGLFKMEHLPENQMVLIEAGDSIWSRANMTDFNASLVFSGPGSAKNNYLMDVYLSIEDEIGYLSSKYASDSQSFGHIIDSLLQQKRDRWNNFQRQSLLSPLAQKVTQAAYVYPYANRLERYALIRGKSAVEKDSSFFNFRQFLNYGEEDLIFFEPYITYLMSYLSQEALEEGKNFLQEKSNTAFNIKRMQLIDENINHPVLRNILTRAVAYEELLNFRNHDYHEDFLQYFVSLNSSPLYLTEILALHNALIQMEPGRLLPTVQVENHKGEITTSKQAFEGQTTVLYFWSQTQMNHFKRTQERVLRYKKAFPNIRFVGLCIQPYNDLVRNYQDIMNISPEDQLALVNFEQASNEWVITLLNKGIVLDDKGVILDGFANFSATDFTEQLRKLLP
ncbi:MAG: hypothetical protein ACPG8F_01010 [Flavobacteriaceae bacterium]